MAVEGGEPFAGGHVPHLDRSGSSSNREPSWFKPRTPQRVWPAGG